MLAQPRFRAKNSLYHIFAHVFGVLVQINKVNIGRHLQSKLAKWSYIVGSSVFPIRGLTYLFRHQRDPRLLSQRESGNASATLRDANPRNMKPRIDADGRRLVSGASLTRLSAIHFVRAGR